MLDRAVASSLNHFPLFVKESIYATRGFHAAFGTLCEPSEDMLLG